MSYTHGNLWTRRSQWCTPIFVFVVFSSRISVFCKKCISLWKTSHRSAKIAPNAYPDTSTDASGRCLDISPSNLGRWGQKMSGIGLGVMKYMYFGPEIGLCALLYKMAVQKVQILVTKTHFASTLGQRPSKFTPTLGRRSGEVTKWSDRVPKWSGEVTK